MRTGTQSATKRQDTREAVRAGKLKKCKMNRVVFVTLLTIFVANEYSNGQMLEPQIDSNKKWGFVDETGKLIIPYKYDNVDGFIEGLAAVNLNGKWGFIDSTNNIVIPLKYSRVDGFSEGLAKVHFNGKCGFIDKNDKVMVPLEYKFAWGFSEKLLKWGPPEGYAMVMIDGKYGFYDRTGTEVVPVVYNTMNEASRKLNNVRKSVAKQR